MVYCSDMIRKQDRLNDVSTEAEHPYNNLMAIISTAKGFECFLSDTPSQFIGTSEDWGAGHFPQNYFGIWGTLLLDLLMYTDY